MELKSPVVRIEQCTWVRGRGQHGEEITHVPMNASLAAALLAAAWGVIEVGDFKVYVESIHIQPRATALREPTISSVAFNVKLGADRTEKIECDVLVSIGPIRSYDELTARCVKQIKLALFERLIAKKSQLISAGQQLDGMLRDLA